VARKELARSATELYRLVDPQWQSYLALPAQVFSDHEHVSVELLEQSLARFDNVVADSRYRNLVARPEFQTTHSALRAYLRALSSGPPTLQLPPPPN
jgi:hypothetical protein